MREGEEGRGDGKKGKGGSGGGQESEPEYNTWKNARTQNRNSNSIISAISFLFLPPSFLLPSSSLLPIPSSLPLPPISSTSQDDRYFLSGSLDGKLRLWNIPDKRVALWNEIESVGETMGERACDGLEMSCDIT